MIKREFYTWAENFQIFKKLTVYVAILWQVYSLLISLMKTIYNFQMGLIFHVYIQN